MCHIYSMTCTVKCHRIFPKPKGMNTLSGSGSGSVAASGADWNDSIIYTVLNTQAAAGSSIQSGAASGKRSMGRGPIFPASTLHVVVGFF